MELKKIKSHCEQISAMSRQVIDEFLMPYAGQTNKLGREMHQQFERYRHITKTFPPSLLPMMQAQYLVHGLFKQGGAIRKYLNHSDLKILSDKKREFIESQALHPWQFSFAQIQNILGDGFYEMLDVFSGETYLLYSPGIQDALKDYPYRLWFNLISFNGECYQSYGPIIGYQAFTPDDIFFFASELTDDVESDEDLRRVVEKLPVPFMMLVTGSTLPPIVAKGDQEMKYAFSEFFIPSLPEFFPEEVFEVVEYMGLVKLTLAEEDDVPHFATAYYDRNEKILQLTSMTLHGYALLVRAFKKLSLDFDEWPDLTVSFPMKTVTEKILRREVEIFPYQSLFTDEMDEDYEEYDEDDGYLESLNNAMQEMLPFINRGESPDTRALAEKHDVDEEDIKRILNHTLDRLRNIK